MSLGTLHCKNSSSDFGFFGAELCVEAGESFLDFGLAPGLICFRAGASAPAGAAGVTAHCVVVRQSLVNVEKSWKGGGKREEGNKPEFCFTFASNVSTSGVQLDHGPTVVTAPPTCTLGLLQCGTKPEILRTILIGCMLCPPTTCTHPKLTVWTFQRPILTVCLSCVYPFCAFGRAAIVSRGNIDGVFQCFLVVFYHLGAREGSIEDSARDFLEAAFGWEGVFRLECGTDQLREAGSAVRMPAG